MNFEGEVNAMIPAFAAILGLTPRLININIQKIDGFFLEIYNITSIGFLLQDSLKMVQFFKKTFLLTDTSMEMVLGIFFLSLNNADIQFDMGELTWRS